MNCRCLATLTPKLRKLMKYSAPDESGMRQESAKYHSERSIRKNRMTPRSRSEKPTLPRRALRFFEARINSASPARVQVEVIHAVNFLLYEETLLGTVGGTVIRPVSFYALLWRGSKLLGSQRNSCLMTTRLNGRHGRMWRSNARKVCTCTNTYKSATSIHKFFDVCLAKLSDSEL